MLAKHSSNSVVTSLLLEWHWRGLTWSTSPSLDNVLIELAYSIEYLLLSGGGCGH